MCADRAAARVPLAASAPLLVKELTPADNLMAVAAYIEKENEAPSPAAAPTDPAAAAAAGPWRAGAAAGGAGGWVGGQDV